ncbi:hypothetical protein J6590_060296 [Homalodisca vitripennis]|nr:hypothetical protein J6590_060296 [Homalodisca vitripennis]
MSTDKIISNGFMTWTFSPYIKENKLLPKTSLFTKTIRRTGDTNNLRTQTWKMWPQNRRAEVVRRINMELQESLEEIGAAMVDVNRFGKRLFTLHGQHLNDCIRQAGALRYDRCICKTTPSIHYSTSNLCTQFASAAGYLRLRSFTDRFDFKFFKFAHQLSSSPINLQLVSYVDAVKSPLRTVSRPSTEECARIRDTDVAETVDAPSNTSSLHFMDKSNHVFNSETFLELNQIPSHVK